MKGVSAYKVSEDDRGMNSILGQVSRRRRSPWAAYLGGSRRPTSWEMNQSAMLIPT